MAKSGKGLVLQDLDRLFRRGTVPSGDGALLDSFLARGDESAFEALVGRHGPMVRGVCRRLLASPHDADDVFQATFLVLVRKGGRLRDPDRLGAWLHGVATREALKARAARRADRTIPDVPSREGGNAEWSDVMPIIDAELARLPAKHREVLVTCLLDGATAEEASHRLACPVGTVKSRLARAREALRVRLTVRGVAPAVAVAVLTSADAFAFASPVSSTLIRATLKAAASHTAASGVVSLITGVAPTMISKSTVSALVLVGLGVAGLGAAAWIKPSLAQVPGVRPRAAASASAPAETEASRIQARNLKEILLASAEHASQEGSFPRPAIYGDGNRPLLSWRVAILPYLGQNELYGQFHLNEAWDSPHNKALINRMPAVFETPAAPAPKGQTRFRGFAGKGSVLDPEFTSDAGQNAGAMGYGGMGSMMAGGGQSEMMSSMMDGMMSSRGTAAVKKGVDRAKQQEEARGREADGTADDSNRQQQPPRGTDQRVPQPGASSVEPEAGGGGAAMGSGMMDGMMGMEMGSASSAVVRRGVNVADITDGTSNTVFIAVARDATPWTKPNELPFVPDQDLPALDDSDPRGYVLGMCDGTVRLLKKDGPGLQRVLTALITRSGGEVVSSDVYTDVGRPSGAASQHASRANPPVAEAPGSASMEERMRTVEEKLDRILERLDAK
ncbi:MAG: sigma-70 family RNA polymerase sigma factor [Paludisphaera borealis]|uniref:sigma-70 family RNA polymerase sigma factor n=1 Tax=Paludisphaera borealis TaxID=1387353 RepID=UPI00284746D9|nr:sigma-70 family RNA polymerase sigma factor [Paludisphaera borealis]MDR3623427.1 sigma-70 family RNA polymerase sigma factor [Paludisphaera borealis]